MRTNKKIIFIFIFLFSFTNLVFSEEKIEEKKELTATEAKTETKTATDTEKKPEYTPLRKMARGLSNATLCWVEIQRQAIKATKKEKSPKELAWSPIKGLTYTATRFCVGVYEVVTFLAPPYKPIVNPEFVFSEEKEEEDGSNQNAEAGQGN